MSIEKKKNIFMEMNKKERIVEFFGFCVFLAMLIYLFATYGNISAKIANHFMFWEKPGALDDKASLLYIPAVTVFIYLILNAIGNSPQHFKYPITITNRNRDHYYGLAKNLIRYVKVEIVVISSIVEISMINDALKNGFTLPYWFIMVAALVMFVTTIYYSYRLSSHNTRSPLKR